MVKRRRPDILMGIFFLFAVGLRLLLFWANPPENSFDDHFEPILLILEQGAIPLKQACWECFQPPVFYILSAAVGRLSLSMMDLGADQQLKLFQFLPCLYGILTVYIVFLILKRINISDFARMLSFGMVCFLPRHIYMSAMHTNDTLSYLLVALCAYLMLVIIDRGVSMTGDLATTAEGTDISSRTGQGPAWRTGALTVLLMAAILLALFTKSTALVLLPVIAALFFLAVVRRMIAIDKSSAVAFALLLIVPVVVLSGSLLANVRQYGQPLPLNIELLEVSLSQPPGRDALSFFNFQPWKTMRTPILAPDNVTSFWTLIYSRLWFDMEPKFLQYTDPDPQYWDAYDDYLNRHDRYEWPGRMALSPFSHFTGSALIALGLAPLALVLVGVGRTLFGQWALWSKTEAKDMLKAQLFLVLLLANLAGVILHANGHPFYSFMKAAFILPALPAMAVFLSFGLMLGEKFRTFRWGISILFFSTFLLSAVHVLYVVRSLQLQLS